MFIDDDLTLDPATGWPFAFDRLGIYTGYTFIGFGVDKLNKYGVVGQARFLGLPGNVDGNVILGWGELVTN